VTNLADVDGIRKHHDPNTAFVFLGMKTPGIANAILGPAFGALLLA